MKNNVFFDDVIKGLSREDKAIPCKYFYDEQGSILFTRICELEEYYITRTETHMLQQLAPQVAEEVGEQANLVEPGSGAGEKIRILLDNLNQPASLTLVDISGEILKQSARRLQSEYPRLCVQTRVGDFTQLDGLDLKLPPSGANLMYFPGSTIGNFCPDEACNLLSSFAESLHAKDYLLIGVDLVKDSQLLENAYDDGQGITAAFNKNLLRRINNELGGNFDLNAFEHRATWNDQNQCVQMHLISTKPQTVRINGNRFHFEADEAIHTEDSHKYRVADFQQLAGQAGWKALHCWQDDEGLFSVHLMQLEA
ncbi:L-histidine N(alpha)-methyltransferase [Bowmanella dokdonensis]|uniref:L-histidine N(Alpha)-methyltransferase n=1 Tax=Bowmanella dokdonensis TaxID=751969 RepID=A0A939DNU9_9ALTE|nr:L-histidine N(alpha)-methyltransferase [Bowmanella dokdonensis]MBN7826014.1 L-histidine N(alpha)-methyltransferase [Bowmanella dokdonensis]